MQRSDGRGITRRAHAPLITACLVSIAAHAAAIFIGSPQAHKPEPKPRAPVVGVRLMSDATGTVREHPRARPNAATPVRTVKTRLAGSVQAPVATLSPPPTVIAPPESPTPTAATIGDAGPTQAPDRTRAWGFRPDPGYAARQAGYQAAQYQLSQHARISDEIDRMRESALVARLIERWESIAPADTACAIAASAGEPAVHCGDSSDAIALAEALETSMGRDDLGFLIERGGCRRLERASGATRFEPCT